MTELLLLNGPNLGILGRREPDIYGTATLADIEKLVAEEIAPHCTLRAVQSDSEPELLAAVNNSWDTAGAIINPGALMIAGWSLRDALAAYPHPFIEVHLSNIWSRESFRHNSIHAPLAHGLIAGLGPHGYVLAAQALTNLLPHK
ncbi:MAG TPA: type II 3-dehydroquinate dehydratase [Actinophytocola sp.]|uniref:type II 3-dehydroquinate dehydratase n=1 Tax=Actinophytocola sp. TaxID=1872138 RepID=UPI002DBD2A45|nr:type II 3-dehydroquinate dehydratase [Actinophytocola sp.]HEU5469386.1 type II 3-dehydroquinate dehydratase [Actinophytocola sp.]